MEARTDDDGARKVPPNFHNVPSQHVLCCLLGVFIICATCILPILLLITVAKLQLESELDPYHNARFMRTKRSYDLLHRRERHNNYMPNIMEQDGVSELEEIRQKLNLLERKMLKVDHLIRSAENSMKISKANEVKGVLLHLAAAEGNLDRIRWLAKFQADVLFRDGNRNQPFHQAARFSHPEVLEKLLEMGAEINSPGDANFTALHWTALQGCDECVRGLLKNGAKVECLDKWCETPLHKAAIEGHVEILKELLRKGAVVNRPNIDNVTSLHFAAENGKCDCVRALLDAGANVNVVNSYGYTPLHLAVKNGYTNCVRALLKFTVDVNLRTNGGNTVLHLANAYQHSDLVELLLRHSAKTDVKNSQRKTPFQCKSAEDL